MSEGTVNSQIVDSVASVVTLTGGNAPAQAFAMLDTVMIETLGMAMYNAVSRQQGASMIGSAAVTAACAKMLGTPFGIVQEMPPAPAPPDPPPHGVQPLDPTPKSPAQVIAEATADAEGALLRMRSEEAVAAANAATVQAAMQRFATQAGTSAAPAPPTPTPTPALYTAPSAAAPASDPTATPTTPGATATHTEMSIKSDTVSIDPDPAVHPIPR